MTTWLLKYILHLSVRTTAIRYVIATAWTEYVLLAAKVVWYAVAVSGGVNNFGQGNRVRVFEVIERVCHFGVFGLGWPAEPISPKKLV